MTFERSRSCRPSLLSNLRWSPDDRRLAFIQEIGGFSFATDVTVVDVSGGTPRRVAGGSIFQGATWLADSSGLIVSSSDGSLMPYPPTYNLWRIALDGGAPIPLTFGESSYEFPDLGPRGNLVVSRVRAQADVWRFPVGGDPIENVRAWRSNHAANGCRPNGVAQPRRVTTRPAVRQRWACQRVERSSGRRRHAAGHSGIRLARDRGRAGLVAAWRLDQFPVEPEFEHQAM